MGGKKRRDHISSSPSESEEELEIINEKSAHAKPTSETIDRPSPRVNASIIANPIKRGEVVLFGGEFNDSHSCAFFDETLLFDIKTAKWTRLNLAVHPAPRSAHQAVLLSDHHTMMLFGGEFGSNKETKFLHYSDTWLFDLSTYSWRALNLREHPSSRSGHRLARVGSFVFLYGGFHDTGKQASCRYLDDLWIFSEQEMKWIQVTWMNEYEARPTARSGFIWLPHPEGILLYGGYTQVKGKKSGELRGQTMNDLWLLRFDGQDLTSLRWKKLKLSPNAPIPRSGATAVALTKSKRMFLFGGVCDEEIDDEFLIGQCLNDGYMFDYSDGVWNRLDLVPSIEGGRFNAMICAVESPDSQDSSVIVMGGICEVGDKQFILDDVYRLSTLPETITVDCLQPLSEDLKECWQRQIQKGDDDDDETSSTLSSSSSSSSSTSNSSFTTDKDIEEINNPLDPSNYSSLKEFFDGNQPHWMQIANERLAQEGITEVNDKKMRSLAFSMAKTTWDEAQELLKSTKLSLQ